MKNEIQKMTSAILNCAECDLDIGTLRTLKMIDDESLRLTAERDRYKAGLDAAIKEVVKWSTEAGRISAERDRLRAEREELIKSVMRWIITNINTERASVEDVPVLYNAYCDCHSISCIQEGK